MDDWFNIEVETRDVKHSFWIPALHGKVDLFPGPPNYIRIEASQPGITRSNAPSSVVLNTLTWAVDATGIGTSRSLLLTC